MQQNAIAIKEEEKTIAAAMAEVKSAVFSLENIFSDYGDPTSFDELVALINELNKRLALVRSIGARYSFIKVAELEKFDRYHEALMTLYLERMNADSPEERQVNEPAKQSKTERKDCIVAVVDTETTGLGEMDEAVSVGIILYQIKLPSGELIREIGSYYGLREPSVPIHPAAQKVHGITIESLKGLSLDMQRLTDLLDQAEVIIAHYAKFDYRMLGKIYPPIKRATWACSCLALRNYWTHMPNRKLDTICADLGVPRPEPHNAMADCRALAAVLFTHSGVTKRSRTYMGHLAIRPWMPEPDD